jgi:hypothetical protein
VLSVWELLAGAPPPAGEQAVVVDDGTGFWEAVSAAELLGDIGYRVALVTPARSVGAAIPFESTAPLLRRLGERSVAFHALMRVMHVGVTAVSLENVLTGERSERPAHFVAGHAGALANDGLVVELERDGTVVRSVGDAFLRGA